MSIAFNQCDIEIENYSPFFPSIRNGRFFLPSYDKNRTDERSKQKKNTSKKKSAVKRYEGWFIATTTTKTYTTTDTK